MRFMGTLFQAIIGLAVLGLAWWGAVNLAGVASSAFPGPVEVWNKALELLPADAFQQHAWASLDVVLYALLPALVVGILLGTAAGGSPAGRWLFGPFLIVVAAAPLVAILPLLIMWFGAGITPKIVFVFLVTASAVANTIMARWPIYSHLKIVEADERPAPLEWPPRRPGRMCAVIGGLRLGVVLGVAALVIAELLGSNNAGVGYFVVTSASLFNAADAMAAALVILLPTIAIAVFLQAIEEQLAG
jgi:ABC-type nitrate/sulfonate/bicarbonate transport system permease component